MNTYSTPLSAAELAVGGSAFVQEAEPADRIRPQTRPLYPSGVELDLDSLFDLPPGTTSAPEVKLAALSPSPEDEEAEARKNDKQRTRQIEQLYRVLSHNIIDLTTVADRKANLLIQVNSILLSLSISFFFSKMIDTTVLPMSLLALSLTALFTILFAVLSTLPDISNRYEKNPQAGEENLFAPFQLAATSALDYARQMEDLLGNRERFHSTMLRDLHSYGVQLTQKRRLLRVSYTIFMMGLVATVLLFFGDTLSGNWVAYLPQ